MYINCNKDDSQSFIFVFSSLLQFVVRMIRCILLLRDLCFIQNNKLMLNVRGCHCSHCCHTFLGFHNVRLNMISKAKAVVTNTFLYTCIKDHCQPVDFSTSVPVSSPRVELMIQSPSLGKNFTVVHKFCSTGQGLVTFHYKIFQNF